MGGEDAPGYLCGDKIVKCPQSFDFAQDKSAVHCPPPKELVFTPSPWGVCHNHVLTL